jgi:hypothetical protein
MNEAREPTCESCTRLREALLLRSEEAERLYKEATLLRSDLRVKDGYIAELRSRLFELDCEFSNAKIAFEEALSDRNAALEKALGP